MTTKPAVSTFDIFDTLVARRCLTPFRAMLQMEARSGIAGFAMKRIEAEREIAQTRYTLHDIYTRLAEKSSLSSAKTAELEMNEMEVEWETCVPIAENLDKVQPQDILVSDMYLPYRFIEDLVREKLGLRHNPIYLSSHGKHHGHAWDDISQVFSIDRHLGDNKVTDIASPQKKGIPAELTDLSTQTEEEEFLAKNGFPSLSEALREARLRTWHRDPDLRLVQIAQVQFNAAILFLASGLLLEEAAKRDIRRILMSSRDGLLWSLMLPRFAERVGRDVDVRYFYSSRVTRIFPTPDYLAYARSLTGTDPTFIVDNCGTGWSLSRLIGAVESPNIRAFLLHKVKGAGLLSLYRETGLSLELRDMSFILDDPSFKNGWFEAVNLADHPTVEDVTTINGTYFPVFSPVTYDASCRTLVDTQQEAFRLATDIILTRVKADEFTGTDERRRKALQFLYPRLDRFLVSHLRITRHQMGREEARVNEVMRSRNPRAAPTL